MKSASFFRERYNMKRKIISIIILALLALGCYLTGYFRAREHFRDATKMVQVDTVTRYDTIIVEKPVLVKQTYYDSLYVAVRDTIRIKDSIFVALPIERKIYKGEDYLAEISGYKANLERIEVYPKTMVISKTETTTLKPSPWRVSVDVGLDYYLMGAQHIAPNIGAEIGYKRVAVKAECGIDMKMSNMIFTEPYFYWKAGIKYSLVRK